MNRSAKAQLIVGCVYIGVLVWGYALQQRNQTTAFSIPKPEPEKFHFPMTDNGDVPVMAFVYVKETGKAQVFGIPDVGDFFIKAM